MLSRQLGCFVVAVLIGLILPSSVAAQIENPRGTLFMPAGPTLPNQDIVDEINAIRGQLGGGVAEQLKGLNLIGQGEGSGLVEEVQREFSQEVSRLAGEGKRTFPQVQLPGVGTIEPGPIVTVSRAIGMPKRLEHYSTAEKLRSVARRMEEIAADLEGVNFYQDADKIRGQAQLFWQKARQLPR